MEVQPAASRSAPVRARALAGGARLAPGLALVAACVAVAFAANHYVPSVPPLVGAVVLGAALSNLGLIPVALRPGVEFAARRLLRLGTALLGFELALGQVLRLGGPGLLIVLGVVTATFFGTQWAGRRLHLSPSLSLLVATGFSICGASAVAAVEGVTDASEEEVAFAIALVTLCGSLSIGLLPLLRGPLGLAPTAFGSWVGASVHDIGQVVATASTAGPASLRAAVVVKLTRVVLLAPIVSGVSILRARGRAAAAGVPGHGVPPGTGARRPPIIPLFVAGFLVASLIRTSGVLPQGVIGELDLAQSIALAAALVGLGAGVHLDRMRRLGWRPLALGLSSWALIASVSYLGVRLVGI